MAADVQVGFTPRLQGRSVTLIGSPDVGALDNDDKLLPGRDLEARFADVRIVSLCKIASTDVDVKHDLGRREMNDLDGIFLDLLP